MPSNPAHSTTWPEGVARTAALAACLDRYGDTEDLVGLNYLCDNLQTRIEGYRGIFSPLPERSRSPSTAVSDFLLPGVEPFRLLPGIAILPLKPPAPPAPKRSSKEALPGFVRVASQVRSNVRLIENKVQTGKQSDDIAILRRLRPQILPSLEPEEQNLLHAVIWVCEGARTITASTRYDLDSRLITQAMEDMASMGAEKWIETLRRGRTIEARP